MKNLMLLLISFIIGPYMLNSLNAVNIVEEGKTWIMKYHNAEAMDLYPDYEYKYFIEGDTLINGKEYKKWICQEGLQLANKVS